MLVKIGKDSRGNELGRRVQNVQDLTHIANALNSKATDVHSGNLAGDIQNFGGDKVCSVEEIHIRVFHFSKRVVGTTLAGQNRPGQLFEVTPAMATGQVFDRVFIRVGEQEVAETFGPLAKHNGLEVAGFLPVDNIVKGQIIVKATYHLTGDNPTADYKITASTEMGGFDVSGLAKEETGLPLR